MPFSHLVNMTRGTKGRPSRKVKPGERSYLLTGIPASLMVAVAARAARDHAAMCGTQTGHERCQIHAVKPTLIRLLKRWASEL
jgi:hypothetical protein